MQVISTVETDSLPLGSAAREVDSETVDTRFSGCTLQCLVNVPREQVIDTFEKTLFSLTLSDFAGVPKQ